MFTALLLVSGAILTPPSLPGPNPNVHLWPVCAYLDAPVGSFRIDNVLLDAASTHRITMQEGGVVTVSVQNDAGCMPERRFRFSSQDGAYRALVCLAPLNEGEPRRRIVVSASGEKAAAAARRMESFQSCGGLPQDAILLRNRQVELGFRSDLDTTGLD
jgi:hypothetical protein